MSFMCIFAKNKTYDAKKYSRDWIEFNANGFWTFHFLHSFQFQTTKPPLRHLLFRAFNSMSAQTHSTYFSDIRCSFPIMLSVHVAKIFHLSIKTSLLLFKAWNHNHNQKQHYAAIKTFINNIRQNQLMKLTLKHIFVNQFNKKEITAKYRTESRKSVVTVDICMNCIIQSRSNQFHQKTVRKTD